MKERARVLWRILVVLLACMVWQLPQVYAQTTGTITGVVVDSTSGETLPGVNVVIAGSTQGSSTDMDGNFVIPNVQPGTHTLQASYVGYETKQVPDVRVTAGGTARVNIALAQTVLSMGEVVVVGYGEQRRRDVTGSVASVSGEELAQVSTPSVEQTLQGRVAGVQVTPSSGQPGAGATVRIRGVGTLNNASPLYVVDGLLLDDINFLNPNDIASMEVLKDASATAIYGSRGANGVIIITTRQGGFGERTRFDFTAYAGAQDLQRRINLTNAQQYAMLANEMAANQGVAPYFPDPNAVGPGVDWQDEIYQSAPMQNYQLSASGGTDRITYFASGNYVRQGGIIPKSDFNRLTFRLNNDYRFTSALRFGHNLNFSYTTGFDPPGIVKAVYIADPTIQPRDEDGNFNDASVRASAGNPAATVFYTRNRRDGGRLAGNLYAETDFLGGFTFRSSFGLDIDRGDYRGFVPRYFVSPTQQSTRSSLNVQVGNTSTWLWENTLTYGWVTGEHRLNLLGGVTTQSFYTELLGGSRINIPGESENLWYLNIGDAEGQSNLNSAEDWRMLSFLFRANYSLFDRYLFTGSLRVDGSSRFSSSNRYGYFPSLAVGWNLAEEPFMRGTTPFSTLKLRASWGQIGNDKIGAYPGIPLITGNLNAVFGEQGGLLNYGASPIDLSNPDVRWERSIQTNIGADLALWNDQLTATLDYYRRYTDGILVQVPIPLYVGASSEPFVNAAKVLNTGLEAAINWNGTLGGLNYRLGINGSTINNEVRELGGGREEILGGGLGNEVTFTTRTTVGEPIGSFWGYKVEGVFQNATELAQYPKRGGEQPGDLRYADLNGDGVITTEDKTFIGSPIPDFIYGFSLDLGWAGFDISTTFTGQSGNEIFNGKKAVRFGVDNFEESFLNRWHGEGTSNSEPRVTNAGHNYQASTRFLENGSFLKLQNIQLGYTLPASMTNRMSVRRARVFVNGTNLFTITPYTGYTPEITSESVIANAIDLGAYPIARTITAGVNLTF